MAAIVSNNDKLEISARMLADVLHDLNPAKSKQGWLEFVKSAKTPEEFFKTNPDGLAEYRAFVAKNDADKHKIAMRKKRL